MKNNKCMGAVVASSILIVVTVVAILGFQSWFTTYQTQIESKIESENSMKSIRTGIENVVGQTLYFNVNDKGNLSIKSVKIDNFDCNISGNYSLGISSLNISKCINNITTSTPEIVIVSDKGIFEKKIYVKSKTNSNQNSVSESVNLIVDINEKFNIVWDSFPEDIVIYNNKLYFNADKGDGVGKELYSYDGTNLDLVEDFNNGAGDFEINKPFISNNLIVYDNKLYFTANDGSIGYELYSYDGTNINLIEDIYTGIDSSNPRGYKIYNSKLYFSASTASTGNELYSYDGSTVSLVEDIYPGNSDSSPGEFIEYDGKLYFKAYENSQGLELYSYDGSTVSLVEDIYPGSTSSDPGEFIEYDGKLYFGANGGNGNELYSYDGSTVNLVEDIYPGSSGSNPNDFIIYDNKLYFEANEGSVGYELYSYDGTNVNLVEDIYPGNSHSYPYGFIVYDNKLYFEADDGNSGKELYSYDGTNVNLVEDIYPGIDDSNPENLIISNNKLYFTATKDNNQHEVYSYDGTNLIQETNINSGSDTFVIKEFKNLGGKLCFFKDSSGGEG